MKNSMDHTYIIGEIGQNHNGSIEIAKAIIDISAIPVVDELFNEELKPLDAVKLTKRDLSEELSVSQMQRSYNGPNSFGKTYGDHREYLELNDEEHFELYKYTKSKGLDFVETLCAMGCLSLFKYFEPDKLKVASRDLTNIPLLEAMAETRVPIILSTGMGGKEELNSALDTITRYHSDVTILHCLSQYPAEYKNINLNSIKYLLENYPDYNIGYSDHSVGISIPIAAVAMGATVIEKHITLDRRMRGSDHKGSLGIDGLNRMVRDIRNLELAMGVKDMFIDKSTLGSRVKLERSIATTRDLQPGDFIKAEYLHMLSPGDGFKWVEKNQLIGREVKKFISKNEIIYRKDLI
jgi:3-deoxy-D-glycero-D-galacto-nononate 9-phosphate synthase